MEQSQSTIKKVYDEYRPEYPKEVITVILQMCGILPNQNTCVADIGSGTGKLTKLLLDKGFKVFGVEPNEDMRSVAEHKLAGYSNFNSINATAEDTGLDNSNISLITSAQSFHYFDREKAKEEFKRILVPNGKVALLWNSRSRESDFVNEYERIIYTLHSKDITPSYAQDKMQDSTFQSFFSRYDKTTMPTQQVLDYEGLWGRTLSNNHTPKPDELNYAKLQKLIMQLFERYQVDGKVVFPYTTRIIVGEIERTIPSLNLNSQIETR